MAVTAVVGGTSGIGRAIVEAILARGTHQVKIFSRAANADLEKELGIDIVTVDYTNSVTLSKAFEENNVHTVISAFSFHTFENPEQNPELNLVKAADASKTTKRFIANEWSVPATQEMINKVPLLGMKAQVQKLLKETRDLEYTVVHNGFFLDWWVHAGIKSYTKNVTWIVDIANNIAAIPGSGDVPAVFTHTTDVAKYTAALLELPKWEAEYFIKGDRVTWHEFVKVAEDIKGTRFQVSYDNREFLSSGKVTELPSHLPMYAFVPKEAFQAAFALWEEWFVTGNWDFPAGVHTLNEDFPDIHPWTVKEALEKAWKA